MRSTINDNVLLPLIICRCFCFFSPFRQITRLLPPFSVLLQREGGIIWLCDRPASDLRLAPLRKELVMSHPRQDPDHCTYIRNMESMVKAGEESIPHIFNKKTVKWWRRFLRGLLARVREERARFESEETEWPIVEGIIRGAL